MPIYCFYFILLINFPLFRLIGIIANIRNNLNKLDKKKLPMLKLHTLIKNTKIKAHKKRLMDINLLKMNDIRSVNKMNVFCYLEKKYSEMVAYIKNFICNFTFR